MSVSRKITRREPEDVANEDVIRGADRSSLS
jgi:hypothetical protein